MSDPETFILPLPDTLKLAVENAHPLDARVVFDPVTHKYFVDGKRYPGSVSGFYGEYFDHFDGAAVVDKYWNNWKTKKDNKYHYLIAFLTGTLGFDDDLAKLEIRKLWGDAGEAASRLGTTTHEQIEYHINDILENVDSPEFQMFLEWRKTHPAWEPYRSEWSVFSEDIKALVTGQIDSIWRDTATGLFHMVDWKRVAEMKMVAFNNEMGRPPLNRIPNTNYGHYIVQQNLYTALVEQPCYGLKIESMLLVQVHPNLDGFIEWPLPRLDHEVATMFADRCARVLRGELRTETIEEVFAAQKRKREDTEEAERAKAREALRRDKIVEFLLLRVEEMKFHLQ